MFLYNCLHIHGAIDVDFTDEIPYINSGRNLWSTSHGLNLQTKTSQDRDLQLVLLQQSSNIMEQVST